MATSSPQIKMSFHHHHHHHSPPPQSHHNNHHCSSCCCCCCFCSSPNSAAPPPQIPSNSSDQQLLQALTAHLLIQSQSRPPQPQHHFFLKPQSHTTTGNPLRHHRSRHHHQQQRSKDDDEEEDPSSLLLLRSLTRRVSALESSLSNLSSSPPPTPPQPHQKPPPPSSRPHSLKHVAAATIQRHFRRFLARRSRTLRDLKRLASIKSHAAALKSSLADKSRKNPRALSQEAMDLLFQLDSIQSSDPIIREGKRSISRELVRISEFVDKVLIREHEEEVDELERRKERVRRVSFVQNGDEAKLFDDLSERNSEEEETHLRDRGFYDRFSDGDESPRVLSHHDGVNGGLQGSNGSSGLAAPLPVKMEPRRSLTGSKKKVAIEED